MDEVVAVALELSSGERRYVITWGRIQATVDTEPLEALVLHHAGSLDLGGVAVSAHVCDSLQEARGERYFYEALVEFAREGRADDWEAWRKRVEEEMADGRHLYYLGRA